MPLTRIVTGGQTGADRAALDACLALRFPCGGWCPAGRAAEDGPIDARYPLRETPEAEPAQRTLWNVRDSDATLILCLREPTGGTAWTIDCAERLGRPWLRVNPHNPDAERQVLDWIAAEGISVLNVAGPRASIEPGITGAVRPFIERLIRLAGGAF